MVRRWNDDCGHQLECDDDAAERRLHRQLLQSLRRRHGPSRFEAGQATPPRPDRARSASEVLSGANPGALPAYLALVVYL
jgi:hypothetical protein